MSREEILEQLNYKGRYTKDVKKRLNKLLKKPYHYAPGPRFAAGVQRRKPE